MKKTKYQINELTKWPGGCKISYTLSTGESVATQHSNVKYPKKYVEKIMQELPNSVRIVNAYANGVLFYDSKGFKKVYSNTHVKL